MRLAPPRDARLGALACCFAARPTAAGRRRGPRQNRSRRGACTSPLGALTTHGVSGGPLANSWPSHPITGAWGRNFRPELGPIAAPPRFARPTEIGAILRHPSRSAGSGTERIAGLRWPQPVSHGIPAANAGEGHYHKHARPSDINSMRRRPPLARYGRYQFLLAWTRSTSRSPRRMRDRWPSGDLAG